jgi:hypothetical protein
MEENRAKAKICTRTMEKAKRMTRRTTVQWTLADPIDGQLEYPDDKSHLV